MKHSSDVHEQGLGPLFAPRVETLVGRTDPPTSHAAAAKMVNSNRLGIDQRYALDAVRRFPGRTCPELAEALNDPSDETGEEWLRQRIGRRLGELEKAGLIRRDGTRDGCSVWYPTDSQTAPAGLTGTSPKEDRS